MPSKYHSLVSVRTALRLYNVVANTSSHPDNNCVILSAFVARGEF